MNCRRQIWPKVHQREVGGKEKIFQLAWLHYNVNNTLLTIVLQERTCKWARNIQEAKETNKTLPVLKAQTHSSVKAGHTVQFLPRYEWAMREWEQGRGREEKHYRAGVLVSTKADFVLGSIKNLFNKEILGVPPIFITWFIYIITENQQCM